MESGICLHSIIPVRAEPSHKSEMVTQILFGELYEITGRENLWYKIRLLFDNYEGWIDYLQANLIGEQEFQRIACAETSVTADLVQIISCEKTGTMIPLVLGSSMPSFEKQMIRVEQCEYKYEGTVSVSQINAKENIHLTIFELRHKLIEDAMFYFNAPYMWGGRSPFGIDCSGFIQMVYKLRGLKLQRDASQQALQGEVISLLGEAEPGDLAFFDDVDGNITHVGLLIDRHHIIHCSGRVRIDSLDHEGIYDVSLQKYTHKLRLIKRII